MKASSPSPDEADDQDKTTRAPAPSDLIRANAGRILGGLLDEGLAGTECAGDSIGPYRLCEIIGEGGFGNVWRAEQAEVVRREVALKVVKLGMDTSQVLRRFDQERQVLAALKHPNIATLLDAGVGPNGRPYFAMELVRGGTLTRWCREQGLALEGRLRLFIQVCLAVQHAHDKGLLHRDLKPSNVLVAEVDGQPVPKIIDFGIAKVMAGDLAEQSLLTQTGQVIGTPLYMSPEQIEGGVELDGRSDVYALGALLYEMLTGVPPFSPDSTRNEGVAEIKRAILETDPERPSTRLRKTRRLAAQGRGKRHAADRLATLPADLDWITLRALEKNRGRRYASAAELAADVRRHLDSQPVQARGSDAIYRTWRRVNRHRKSLATSGAGIGISILALSAPGFFESALWLDFRSAVRHAWVFDIGFTAAPSAAEATRVKPYENRLGMRFVPVPITGGPTDGQRVLFSIWATRVRDYEVFASETKRQWIRPQFEQGPTHPVVLTSWNDAQAFCAWLTERERKVGRLGQDLAYRLPSDHEWSCAVGIGDREDPAQPPVQKRGGLPGIYPWGTQWPPPERAGNYLSQETMTRWLKQMPNFQTTFRLQSIPDYRDGYALTAPVGNYAPNALGLHDLGGNVWEWCADLYDHGTTHPIRGCSWLDYKDREDCMLSSMRGHFTPLTLREHVGFRVVLASVGNISTEPTAESRRLSFPLSMEPSEAAKHASANRLGMRFQPVPITGGPTDGQRVLFSIWPTRVQDYQVFVSETKRDWTRPQFEQGPTHPVVQVSWHDAQAFCAWLTGRERKAGRLGEDLAYRLPSDHEWSCAVGIGDREDPAQLPALKRGGLPGIYPWGMQWPPPDNVGNYRSHDAQRHWLKIQPVLFSLKQRQPSPDYQDGYALTSPVGVFPANALGLYDIAGNVWEWCEDWFNQGTTRTIRGGSWYDCQEEYLRSSRRGMISPDSPHDHLGFRVVLAPVGKLAGATFPKPAIESSGEATVPPPSLAATPSPGNAESAFTNSLGMKFLPVPGTSVLFCMHETRRRDYAVFAETAPNLDGWWKTAKFDELPVGHEDDHPVAGVSWTEAVHFCDWLSQKEGRKYRLPTHAEWCVAVGLKETSNPGSTEESQRIEKTSAVPWGSGRMEECGNYADASFHERFPARPAMRAVRDGHATTAPVMSFKPNLFGLHDMGGNMDEWCSDWFDDSRKTRVSMGGCFSTAAPALLLSSFRGWGNPTAHMPFKGFRIVMEHRPEETQP